MSSIGYYRLKKIFTSNSTEFVYINGTPTQEKLIVVKDYCSLGKIIKYLNRDGQFRFLSFNKFWEQEDKPKEIGKVNQIITTILNTSSSKSLGYKNERRLSLVSDNISLSELEQIQDLYVSPLVYLKTDSGEWIEVEVNVKNAISKIKKGGYTDLTVEIILPEWYTINLT